MKVDRAELESTLPQKGFQRDPSGDHVYFYFIYNGRETGAYTKVSHTKKMKDITRGLLNAVKNQLKLDTNKDVVDLVTCPMSEEDYIEKLIQKGVIQPDPETE